MESPRLSSPILAVFAGALALAGCFSNSPPANTTGAGTAGTSGGAGSSASGTAGSTGTAGSAGTAGSTGTAGAAGGSGGTTGAAGSAAGAGGALAGASGAAGMAGASGAAGGAGATAGAGAGGIGGAAGGPAVYTTKPMSVIAYSPYRDGQAPGGAQPTMAQVKSDLMMLQPLVDGIRIYATDGALGYVPALCDQLGIDLHIGAWIDGIATDEPNVHALATIVNQNHPSIKTAIIGNEVLARAAKMKNNVTEARMIQLINLFKADLTVKTVKIATADTYPQWMLGRPNLAAAVDVIIWHTYGYWSGVDISTAFPVVNGRYNDMLAAYPGKPMILGETGWPTMVDLVSMDMTTTAVANEANQARFYREALAGFRARNLPAWFFDSIDEMWKGTSGEGAVGSHWGIFTTARAPKQAATELMMMVK
jgi:exo-beta-1,3-glucanase (GH17 family)